MTPLTCLKSIQDTGQGVKSPGPGSQADLAGSPLIRAERTPGAVAVSQVIQGRARAEKSALVSCLTNSELPLMRGSFFVERSGTGGSPFSVILDSVAENSEAENGGFTKPCPGGFITGSCENGHRYAAEIYCMREWCPTCNGKWVKGEAMKPGHARRFGGWHDKATKIDGMGYWTFTIPEGERWKYRSQEALSKLGRQVVELLKSFGYERGLRRWHWFGDRSQKWHPHLNCLVDGGLLNGKALRAIRRTYSKLLGVKLAIAEYHYIRSPGEKVHALRYVTRATFLDAKWDIPMALELRGFRNTWCWGGKKWCGPAVWSLDDLPGEPASGLNDADTRAVAALELGYCPLDGLPIVWERWQPISRLAGMGGRRLAAGYWILPGVSPPPYRYADEALAWVSPDSGNYKRSLRGSFVPAELVDSRLAEFSRQHRRFVANWSWSRHLEAQDLAMQEAGGFYPQGQSCLLAHLFRLPPPLGGELTARSRGSE